MGGRRGGSGRRGGGGVRENLSVFQTCACMQKKKKEKKMTCKPPLL